MLASALIAGGMSTVATAGSGSDATAAAGKKKKKTCPAGTTKKVVKKKNGKKKVTCTPNPAPTPTPVTPAPLAATLSITPTSVDFGSEPAQPMSGCAPFPMPDGDCPTQNFTVSNGGPGTTGPPAVSITDIATDPGGERAFAVVANGCTIALAPGAICVLTVRGAADNEFAYVSRLDVTASPGNTASASLAID